MDTTAILARTNLALRPFEQALAEAGIPYRLLGKAGYWAQPEIRLGLAFLAASQYPSDWVISACIRAPFDVCKYLPKTKLVAALKAPQNPGDATMTSHWWRLTSAPGTLVEPKNLEAVSSFTSLIHSLSRYRDLPAGDALKKILDALGAWGYYSESEMTPDNDPVGNLQELVKLASKHSTVKQFLDYARKVTAASKSKKGVMLSTVHGFKGLQAHTVYFVGVSDGLLPHVKSDDIQSERNVWFVGCSRAERRLVITYSGVPSIFLKNLSQTEKTVV